MSPIPDFVVAIREKIGHDPLWLPGVTAVVRRGDQVLLVERADNGRWTPITGIPEPGEEPAVAAAREALEEAGLPPELTEDGLVIDVELSRPEAETWMRAFTDIRLALATRLGVEAGDEDYWHSLPEDDPAGQVYGIYQWVGILQETIVEALWSAE